MEEYELIQKTYCSLVQSHWILIQSLLQIFCCTSGTNAIQVCKVELSRFYVVGKDVSRLSSSVLRIMRVDFSTFSSPFKRDFLLFMKGDQLFRGKCFLTMAPFSERTFLFCFFLWSEYRNFYVTLSRNVQIFKANVSMSYIQRKLYAWK